MSNEQKESTASRRQEVGEWLRLALSNAKAAVLLAEEGGLERQALYMVEQSMETAAKGVARRATKMSYGDVKAEGHQLLHLYAKTLDEVVRGTGTASRMDKLLARLSVRGEAYSILNELQLLLALSASPKDEEYQKEVARKFFSDMGTASPETIDDLLTVLETAYDIIDAGVNNSDLVNSLVTKPLVLKVPPSSKNLARIMSSRILRNIQKRKSFKRNVRLLLQDIVPRMMENAISGIGERRFLAGLQAKQGEFSFTKEQLLGSVKIPKASVGILIIGSIAWPHGSYTRYPAKPGAPQDAVQAARDGSLGSEHYTDTVGAIRHIRRIAAHAHEVATLLHTHYEDGFFFPDWAADETLPTG